MTIRLLGVVVLLAAPLLAQPTYRLDVRKDLKPTATLSMEGGRIVRTEVADDPGFRLQFRFQKGGKDVATPDARAERGVTVPSLEAGTYTVVLELFHPAYKGGTERKGAFVAISPVLTYKVEGGKLTLVPTPPAPPPAKK